MDVLHNQIMEAYLVIMEKKAKILVKIIRSKYGAFFGSDVHRPETIYNEIYDATEIKLLVLLEKKNLKN